MLRHVLDIGAVGSETSVGSHTLVNIVIPLAEAPLLAHVDLLTAGELELGTSECLND